MDDRTLLEDAARAAGIGSVLCYESARACLRIGDRKSYRLWRPLTDDGDALRLAVKLRLDIDHHEDSVNVWQDYFGTGFIPNGDDPAAATRRAIVLAAAAIGRQMREAE